MTPDVLVVGGGPAGAAAAILLARGGREVLLVDKARFPREKCCGDGLTTGTLHRLERLGLDPASVASFTPVPALMASSPSGRMVTVPLGDKHGIYAAVARRRDLDAALLDVARAAGVSVHEGDGVTAVEIGATGVVATCASGAMYDAPLLVAADGARSAVRRALRAAAGDDPQHAGRLAGRDAWLAYRQYVTNVSARAAEELWVRFDRALLPGYGWSFPLAGGVANVGIGMPRADGTAGASLRRAWNDALASPFFTSLLGDRAVLEGQVRAWPIPTGVRREDLVGGGGRVLFLGDAAATADPFTGEGIAQALASAEVAAEAVLAGTAGAARRYEMEAARTFFLEHHIARATRKVFTHPLGARACVGGTELSPAVTATVGGWLYERYPRTVVARPSLWRRSTFNRPGPYAAALRERSGWPPTAAPGR